ncbi:TonB family protein [Pedobacter sp. UYP30]|uniref:energy transducer TonB family protein n=1 Tax=Pedobacter sp. UYP30 TaxID=1756400 RepID=UPI00339AA358
MKKLLAICFILYCTIATAQLRFKSSPDGFANFLKQNTIYPPFSKDNCIQGTTEIRFKLDAEGKVYFSEISKRIGTDLDEEALRLVRMSSGKWLVPSGYDTTTYVVVPVKFTLQGYNCETKSQQEINQAINQYQVELGQINTIENFYKNFDAAKPGQEQQIVKLKNQLGIDDDYLSERIKMALKKIKQGDNQGACEDFNFVKNMGSNLADDYLKKYCK